VRVKISKTRTTPRSGVGLDELLGRTSLSLQAFPENRLWQRTHERDLRRTWARCALAEGLRDPRTMSNTPEVLRLGLAKELDSRQTAIFHGCGLTPELRRTALRPCVGENLAELTRGREAVSA
jgi:hypothetical protein